MKIITKRPNGIPKGMIAIKSASILKDGSHIVPGLYHDAQGNVILLCRKWDDNGYRVVVLRHCAATILLPKDFDDYPLTPAPIGTEVNIVQ